MNATVQLVPVDPARHAHALFHWRAMPEIAIFMYTPGPSSMEEHLAWLNRITRDESQAPFVIEHECHPVGFCSISSINRRHARGDFNMYVGEAKARMRGVGAAAEILALDHAFHQLAMHKVGCEVFSSNETAIRMHLRMGFQIEGTFRDHAHTAEGWTDVVRMSILADEWEAARKPLFPMLGKMIQSSNHSS